LKIRFLQPRSVSKKLTMVTVRKPLFFVVLAMLLASAAIRANDLEQLFSDPPSAAKPRVMWPWMGCHVSRTGITRDLEALRDAGFGGTLMFSLSDSPLTWSADIAKSPTPEIITWSEPWWELVRHAALESQRLGLAFGIGNCAGYGTSGGPWITPELSMQQICWSETPVDGGQRVSMRVPQPQVDPRAINPWPVYNSDLRKEEFPVIPARKTFYRDITLLALPATGTVAQKQVINLSDKVGPDGQLNWEAPTGQWIIYRFGRTVTGTLQFPAQWEVNGLECDKMNPKAVAFHINHVISEIDKHLGDLPNKGLEFLHFDSYEAGPDKWTQKWPYWTPKMPQEFTERRGYDLLPFLPTMANRTIDSEQATTRFRADLDNTIRDLYRDYYYGTLSTILRQAGLLFSGEPYLGPWRVPEVTPHLHRVVAEFWNDTGRYGDFMTATTIAAARQYGHNIIEAEAFTSRPAYCPWNEYPGMIKATADTAFCEGINRFVLHRYTHQPYDDRYRPGFTMGQWGTHFDRTQTWWEPGKAMFRYWQRCQALLQWGTFVDDPDAFKVVPPAGEENASAQPQPKFIHRQSKSADVFFVANVHRSAPSKVTGSFSVTGKQPELWDAITGTRRDLPRFDQQQGRTLIPLEFAPAQSWFVVFRKPYTQTASSEHGDDTKRNFSDFSQVAEMAGPWQVTFDPQWGGPEKPVTWDKLEDWTSRPEPGIRYYSGTAVYKTLFDVAPSTLNSAKSRLFLHLGRVNHIARVRLNGQDLGVVWTAPWQLDISDAVRKKANQLEIEVTNVWANRLIGDEQEPADCVWFPSSQVSASNRWCRGVPLTELPDWLLNGEARPSKGRYCFTTWNYFSKNSPLVPSGLFGPVRLMTTK